MKTHKPMSREKYSEYLELFELPADFNFETAYAEYCENWNEQRADEQI